MKIGINNRLHFGAQFNESDQKKFMQIAQEASTNSLCERAKTGAAVITPKGEIGGVGYNVIPGGITTCQEYGGCIRKKLDIPSGTLYDQTCQSIHAEENAISAAGRKLAKAGTLFLHGHYHLCDPCIRKTALAGIEDVYVQFKPTDAIKHYSIKELIADANKHFKAGLIELANLKGIKLP